MKNNDTKIEQYILTNDAYTGEGGFSNGSYLFPYSREMDYNVRKKQAFYSNLLMSIVDSTVDPVFNEEAKREYDNELVEAFLDNVDNAGTSMDKFIYGVTLFTKLLGNMYVVMDNFSDVPESLGDIIATRKYPYVYSKKPQDVYEYTQDEFGNLTYISFYYTLDSEGNQLYKGWDDSVGIIYRCDDQSGERLIVKEVKHNLGVVPVISWDKEVLPFPPYYSMATIARAIYNVDSEMRELTRSQGFSILVIPGQQPKSGIVIGKNNALFISENASAFPAFISPNQSILDSINKYRDSLVNSLLQSGDILGSTAMSNASSSGVALAYRFMGTADSLKGTAQIAKYYDEKIIKMFGTFFGTEFEYEVEYCDNYIPSFVETQAKLVTLENLLALNINDTINAHIEKVIVDYLATMSDADDDEVAMLKQSIDDDTSMIDEEPIDETLDTVPQTA